MSKYVLRLTDALIKQAAPKDKIYKLSDGAGLYIAVQPSGSKVWRMKYLQQSGGESVLTFGRYPEVSIAKAREHRLAAHQLLER
ncbi:Arm DNA-binding domain-containing protein [Janthinobacterium sp. P210006]|uniref:Arm DNA-binding domain-containing protein n=1 Tax=Janthinobacterium sp. P210006 TaxID=3112939 RepID=UPI002E27659D|nr:Arm DNA-binding domain-containing protein [Janthinobacterium sp. P210006]